ncbi:cation diffusion facilitator family transporter [Nocardioides nanhaiensis]|uniref:Cation diffusion facilitator family transporter n=1 Tax=Nocardioides nanhaiensis TaxID=1476871 RepID=A0ABP8WE05_9ACTN
MTSGGEHDDHHHDGHDHIHHHPAGVLPRLREALWGHSHDHADSVDDALSASAEGIRAVKTSLVVLLVTALLQAALVAVTGSVALLADTIHNFSDAFTSVPLWIAFVLGRRATTRAYTYGYGRAEDLAGVFIVVMIAVSAVVAGVESFRRLLDPQPLSHPWVVAAAGVIGFLGNELVASYRIRVGGRIGSAALVADGRHARTDGFTSLAVVAGAGGALLGVPLADPIVGLLITAAILVVLRGAATEVYRRLMDAVDPALTERAEAAASRVPGVHAVADLRLRWIGHRLHGELSVTADPELDLAAAHAVAHAVEAEVGAALPKLGDATVHVGPAGSGSVPPGTLRRRPPRG